jgi:tRNA A-37 threonylcarbamoyl transferase component Bud32
LEPSTPSIPAAHDPETMRALLQRSLAGHDGRSYRVQECRIANTRHRDGSRGTIMYDLRLEDPDTGHVWEERVTGITFGGNRTRRVWESIRQTTVSGDNPGSVPAVKPFAYVADLDLLLQVFPHDVRLPGLALLLAGPPPELLPSLVDEFGTGDWRLQRWDATTVQYRADMRAILRVTVAAIDTSTARVSERQFFAKVYRDEDQARQAYRAQSDLHHRVSAINTHLVIAKPIVYVDTLRTLVTEAVPGVSLSKIIRRGKGSQDAVRSAARAVADFHQLDVAAPLRSVADEITLLQEARAFLASARPDLAEVVSSMVEAVTAGLETAPSSLIHGDLKPDHMLLDSERVALIDFDLIGRADPVVDVAHLLGFLGRPQERSRSGGDGPHDVGQVFVDEYFTHVPDSWRGRLPLHHAITGIHKAVGLCRRRGGDQQHRVEDVLREGQAFLESDVNGSVPSYKRRLTRSTTR